MADVINKHKRSTVSLSVVVAFIIVLQLAGFIYCSMKPTSAASQMNSELRNPYYEVILRLLTGFSIVIDISDFPKKCFG